MEDNQTTIEMETHPPKPPTSESIELSDDDAQNSRPVGSIKTINNIIILRTYLADGRQPDDYRAAEGASGS